jgi:hypothetical protein
MKKLHQKRELKNFHNTIVIIAWNMTCNFEIFNVQAINFVFRRSCQFTPFFEFNKESASSGWSIVENVKRCNRLASRQNSRAIIDVFRYVHDVEGIFCQKVKQFITKSFDCLKFTSSATPIIYCIINIINFQFFMLAVGDDSFFLHSSPIISITEWSHNKQYRYCCQFHRDYVSYCYFYELFNHKCVHANFLFKVITPNTTNKNNYLLTFLANAFLN